MTRIGPLFPICLFFLFAVSMVPGKSAAQKAKEPQKDDVQPRDFEELRYPLAARLAHTEGVVVMDLKVKSDGTVADAVALTGPKALIPESIANAKKWRFDSSSGAHFILVYRFHIEGLCHGAASSYFAFYPPNFADIRSCDGVVEPSITR